MEALRQCPLAIVQQLVFYTTAVSTDVLGQSHKDKVRCEKHVLSNWILTSQNYTRNTYGCNTTLQESAGEDGGGGGGGGRMQCINRKLK